MSIIYRIAEKKDYELILSMVVCSTEEYWGQAVKLIADNILHPNPIEKIYVAQEGNDIVGIINGYVLPNKTLLPQFSYVKPELRNRGIGTGLLNKLESDSDCNVSMIFYNKDLHDHYMSIGYETGANLETAIKEISIEE